MMSLLGMREDNETQIFPPLQENSNIMKTHIIHQRENSHKKHSLILLSIGFLKRIVFKVRQTYSHGVIN